MSIFSLFFFFIFSPHWYSQSWSGLPPGHSLSMNSWCSISARSCSNIILQISVSSMQSCMRVCSARGKVSPSFLSMQNLLPCVYLVHCPPKFGTCSGHCQYASSECSISCLEKNNNVFLFHGGPSCPVLAVLVF